jgi:hypothetical protein
MWGDMGCYMLVPVNTTTCKHTHTHTLVMGGAGTECKVIITLKRGPCGSLL